MSEEIKYSTFFVDLPSEGKLYSQESPLSEGSVEMRFGSAEEEDILMSVSYIQKKIVFDKLLDSLIVNSTINIDDLVMGDKNALIVAARRSMYGDKYTTIISCPKCNEQETYNIDLSELDVFKLKNGISENSFLFTTPDGKEIKYHLLTGTEIKDIEKTKKKMKKLGLRDQRGDMLERMKRYIDAIDKTTDKNEINSALSSPSFRATESAAIRENMINNSPALDLSVYFSCGECGYEEFVDFPLDTNFFWPTGGKNRRSA